MFEAGAMRGHCRILGKLGEGGKGGVHRSRDGRLDGYVALKVEAGCERQPFDYAQGRLRGSEQAKPRAKRGISR